MPPLDIAMLVIVAAVWGVNFAAVKTGLAQLPPMTFVALRFAAVAALLVPFAPVPRRHRAMRRFAVNQVMPFTLLVPVFGVLSGIVVFDERLTARMIAGGLCTIAGVAIITIRRPRVVAPWTKAGL